MTVCAGPSLPCPTGPVADLLAAIEVVRLELGSVGAAGDPRICASLLRASSAVDGLALREVAAMDAYGTCHKGGQGSAAAVVQGATGCSVQAARGTVRLAERLDVDLRPLGDLLVAGQVSGRHCTAVVHGVRGLGAEVIATALEAICTLALHADPERLASELRTRAEAISPELAEQARRRLDARVGVSCDETPTTRAICPAPCIRRPWRCSRPSPTRSCTASGSRATPAARSAADTMPCRKSCSMPLTAPGWTCRPRAGHVRRSASWQVQRPSLGWPALSRPVCSAPGRDCSRARNCCGCSATRMSARSISAPTSSAWT